MKVRAAGSACAALLLSPQPLCTRVTQQACPHLHPSHVHRRAALAATQAGASPRQRRPRGAPPQGRCRQPLPRAADKEADVLALCHRHRRRLPRAPHRSRRGAEQRRLARRVTCLCFARRLGWRVGGVDRRRPCRRRRGWRLASWGGAPLAALTLQRLHKRAAPAKSEPREAMRARPYQRVAIGNCWTNVLAPPRAGKAASRCHARCGYRSLWGAAHEPGGGGAAPAQPLKPLAIHDLWRWWVGRRRRLEGSGAPACLQECASAACCCDAARRASKAKRFALPLGPCCSIWPLPTSCSSPRPPPRAGDPRRMRWRSPRSRTASRPQPATKRQERNAGGPPCG